MNHELGSSAGVVRAHGARGAFVSKWTIRKDDLTVLHGEDLIQTLNTWDPTLNGGAGDWTVVEHRRRARAAQPALLRRPGAGLGLLQPGHRNGYNGRIFAERRGGRHRGTGVRPRGRHRRELRADALARQHVVRERGRASEHRERRDRRDGPRRRRRHRRPAGLLLPRHEDEHRQPGPEGRTGERQALRRQGRSAVPQSEYQKTDWEVGDEFNFELVDVSQYAGVGGRPTTARWTRSRRTARPRA